mgnify:CR=1 FL=1
MSFENTIISEKYLNKLIELNKKYNTNYIKTRNNLLAKYLLCEKINNFPISDSYISTIVGSNPFIIKTDLFTELNELNNILNQGGLVNSVRELSCDLAKELEKEIEIRKNMDEGQVIERELSMLEDFKKEYGYDPTYISVINYNNNDGINTNDSKKVWIGQIDMFKNGIIDWMKSKPLSAYFVRSLFELFTIDPWFSYSNVSESQLCLEDSKKSTS